MTTGAPITDDCSDRQSAAVGGARREPPEFFAARLMEFLVVPAFVLDATGAVMIWNKACERLTATPASEVIGTKDHWKAFYDHERPCLADLVIENRTAEVATLYATAPLVQKNPNGLSAENWCVMPRAGQRLYAAIDVGAIYDEHGVLVAVVETLRDMTAQKLMEMELQELVGRDPLTSLANRRTFDLHLKEVWTKSRQAQRESHLILVDVDNFKDCNDRFGHPAGDQCLRLVADALKAAGPDHLAARIGGDEFAVIVTQATEYDALAVAVQLRERFESICRDRAEATPPFRVTLSVGLASISETRSPDNWFAAADCALYEAKRRGRNGVVVFEQPAFRRSA